MTDEERQELVAKLRRRGYNMDAEDQAADEIERLAKELAETKEYLRQAEQEAEHFARLTFVDIGANPAISWKERAKQAERERDELRRTLNLQAYEDNR